jgi:hypothetical protein
VLAVTSEGGLEAAPALRRVVARCAAKVRPDLIYAYVSSGAASVDLEGLPPAPKGYRRSARATGYRYALVLPTPFEAFLDTVSYKTRRNLRRALRAAAADGRSFGWRDGPPCPEDFEERLAVGRETRPVAKTAARLTTLDAFLATRGQPVTVSLRSREGRLLSLAAGFIAGSAFYLVYQLNDGRLPELNLALTTRGLLIEALIERGIGEAVFPNGIGGSLAHACTRQHGCEAIWERTSLPAQLRLALWGRRRRFRGPEHRAYRRSRGWSDTK